MRILLVSTYELGHQPLHLASPAARLIREGHDVQCLDLAVEDWDESRFERAQAVAFSVPMHTAMRLAVDAATRLHDSHPDLPVAFYGLYAAVGADRTVGTIADRLIVGEYEDELADWISELGISELGRGLSAERPIRPSDVPIRIDIGKKSFDRPARQLLPRLDKYARFQFEGEERLAGYVEASHGCRHRCRHCPIPAVYDGRYRVTGLETVMSDVAALVEMGARHITFGDPDFFNAPRYAMDVLREVNGAFPELTFDLTVKVEHILDHRELWPEVASRNVAFVVSAFETTNDEVLQALDKGHTAADMATAVAILKGVGIQVRPSWMPFTPLTRPGDLSDIFDFLVESELLATVDPVQLSIRLLIPEGSLILSSEMAPFVGDYQPEALSFEWHSHDPAVDVLQRRLAEIAASGASGANDERSTLLEMWLEVKPGVSPPAWPHGHSARLSESWFCCAEPTNLQLLQVNRA